MESSSSSAQTRFPEFSESEYLERVRRVQAEMLARGMDALLLTGKENLRYFAGAPLTELTLDNFNTFFLVLPADPALNLALLMSCGREGPASASWIEDRRFWGYGESGSIMEHCQSLGMVTKTIGERGLTEAVIGIETDQGMRIGMTFDELRNLQQMLPKATFRSAADAIWPVRTIKSPAEIEKIRRACHITCDAFAEALRRLKPGMTEKAVAGIIRAKMFEGGATGEGFLAVYGGPRAMWADTMPSDYQFQRGDLIMFDGGCTVDGYFADVSRMACLGEPSPEARRHYELARQANAEALAVIRPGTPMRELHAAGQRAYRENSAGNLLVFGGGQLGHGIGLTVHEPPDIAANSDKPLESGMTIAVEPAITNHGGWLQSDYFVIVENNVAVTKDGYDMLTPLNDALWIA